jgi:hypothetical protein
MKTTVRLLLVFGASMLTAAPASAWHHHHRYGYGMAPMPVVPIVPITGMGFGTLPILPTAVGGGAGFSMSLSMSGDPILAMMLPGLLRNLAGTFLGVPGAAGMTEAQIVAIARAEARRLLGEGAAPLTQAQGERMTSQLQTMSNQLQALNDLLRRALGDRGIFLPQPKSSGTSAPSPEVEKARAEIRRLVAEGVARRNGRAPGSESARAEIRRLVAEGAARQNRPAGSDLERARAEVRRLVAEGAARQNARNRPPVTTLASGAK